MENITPTLMSMAHDEISSLHKQNRMEIEPIMMTPLLLNIHISISSMASMRIITVAMIAHNRVMVNVIRNSIIFTSYISLFQGRGFTEYRLT
jgi:hypothetical protein